MKTIHLLTFVSLLLFVSCQDDETSTETDTLSLTENWKKLTPEEAFETAENGFYISEKAIQNALKFPNVTTIRFSLEANKNQLQLRVLGADDKGNTSKGILAKPRSMAKEISKLNNEKGKNFEVSSLQKSVAKHVIQPVDAAAFIARWQQHWENKTFMDAITYNNQRIEYFSMPRSVGEQMLKNSAEGINLVWGANEEGKLTTVFLPEATKDKFLLKEGDYAFEYSSPCPPTCPK